MVGSEAVDAELSLMPSSERRAKIVGLAQLRAVTVTAGETERARAIKLMALGIGYMDALTDDKLLAKADNHKGDIMVRVANPLDWIVEVTAP